MSYHPCRWYDPYPKLAFALKLLYLAPKAVKNKVITQIQTFLMEEWHMPQSKPAFAALKPRVNGARWYDEDTETAKTVELLKNSPDFLKTRVADSLLAFLMAESA